MIERLGLNVNPALDLSNSVQVDSSKSSLEPISLLTENNQEQPKPVSKDQLEKVIDSMNDFVSASNSHLKFEYHDKLEEYYVTIVDDNTQEVIREIPSKKLLDIYAAMNDYLGLMVDKKI